VIGKLIGKVVAETALLPLTVATEATKAAEQAIKTVDKRLS